MKDHLTEIIVAAVIFLVVSVMGFVAARWKRADDMGHLDEWASAAASSAPGDVVPGRRRPLHGVHVRGRAGARVRGRGEPGSSRCRTR